MNRRLSSIPPIAAAFGICALACVLPAAAAAQLAPGPTAFICQARALAVEPPQPSPPALQTVGDSDRILAAARKLSPVCPEGTVPVLAAPSARYFHKGNPLLGSYWAPGPAHALPREFVKTHLLLSFDHVYGTGAGKPAQPSPPSLKDATAPVCNGTYYYGSCYYYANAAEYSTSDGGGMSLEIELPVVVDTGDDGGHSIGEIAVEGANYDTSLNDVEMGFNVSPDQYGDAKPHLFVYHWIDNGETCYDTCAWNQYSNIYYPGMDISDLVGQQVYLGWVHDRGAWWAWFNDQWLGYILDSQWSNDFTQSALIQWYGEVAEGNGDPPLTQMGNGQFAEQATAATMATLCNADASTWVCNYDDQQSAAATHTGYYDILNHSSFGAIRYGGPGRTDKTAPAVTVTPSVKTITTAQPLSVAIAVAGGNGKPTPTGAVTLNSGSYLSAAQTLTGGSATIDVPSGSLPAGAVTLLATYTPDTTSSSTYENATNAAIVNVNGTAPKPVFSLPAGSYTSTQQVRISDAVTGAAIYYTLNGSTPTVTPSEKYSTALTIAATTTVKAIAAATGYLNSTVASATYTILKPQTIHFTQPTSPVTYGVTPMTLSASSSSGLPVSFKVVSGPAKVSGTNGSTLTITGAGAVVVAANQAGNTVYGAAPQVTWTITVYKTKLTVTANNLSMKHGAAVPTLTCKMTGFVNGDTQAKATTGQPALSTTATSDSAAGAYPITVKTGTLEATNYNFAFVKGTLTVTN